MSFQILKKLSQESEEKIMAKYIDGFVIVIPKEKGEDYKKMAEEGKEAWMRHGALAYYECRGDELKTKEVGGEKAREFTDMAGAGENENIWMSFITFNSKEHRDEVNKKVMDEMSEKYKNQKDAFEMPFETKRMAYGGFEVEVEG